MFNLQLRMLRISYSTVALPQYNIPAGMLVRSDVSFLGLDTKVDFLMEPTGGHQQGCEDPGHGSAVRGRGAWEVREGRGGIRRGEEGEG